MGALFISYASDDQSVALEVCALLEAQGIRCWIAPRDVAAGAKWDEAIVDAITDAQAFLLLLTGAANASPFVSNEVNHAFTAQKPIFTFRIEDVTPSKSIGFYLARHHWSDGFPAPIDGKVAQLAAAVTAVMGTTPQASGVAIAAAPKRMTASAPALLAPASSARPSARPARVAWILAAIGAFVLGAVAMRFAGPGLDRASEIGSRAVTRALVSVAPADQLRAIPGDQTNGEGRPSRTAMAFAPDGRSFVFSAVRDGRQQLYLRALDQLDATPIAGTEDGAGPFFSPDGQWVGFWAGGALKKSAIGGGPPSTICETLDMVGASWGSDDTIVFARRTGGLWRVSSAGGIPESLTTLDAKKGEVSHRLPQMLPGNGAVLFTVTHSGLPRWDDTEVVVQSLVTGTRTTLVEAAADARYVPTGHLLYVRRGTLMAVGFDMAKLAVIGGSVALMSDLMQAANMTSTEHDTGAAQLSVSDSGSLLYIAGGIFPDAERSIVWVDRSGAVEPLPFPPRPFFTPHLSPDGQRLLVWTQGDRNVWLGDIARSTLTLFTVEGRSARAIWTPDGKRVTFGSSTAGPENLFLSNADRSGTAERLGTSDTTQAAGSWSPDGQTLAFVQRGSSGDDIWTVSLAGDRLPSPLMQTRFAEAYPDFSPDGRWLAYTSNESGREEVYVQPYPGPGARQLISSAGGSAPGWSKDGRELFYTIPRAGGEPGLRMISVPVTTGSSFAYGAPRMLFDGPFSSTSLTRGYDVTADGRRFLMIQPKERPAIVPNQMVLVENWFEELKKRVPTK